MIIQLTVANFLVLTHSVRTNIHGLVITHSLNLSDSITLSPNFQIVSNHLGLSQSVQYKQVRNLEVSDTLTFTQDLSKVPAQSTFNHLYIFQSIEVVKPKVVKSTLTLTQTVNVVKGQGVQSNLTLSQSILVNRTVNLSVNNTLTLVQYKSGYKPDDGFIFGDYEIGSAVTTLQFVFPGWNLNLPLRNPEFGNNEQLSFTRVFRRSRAGDIRMFREPTWPASRSFSYTINGLCPGTAKKLLDFLRITIGRTVRLIDYENREWDVFIMTPAADVSEQFAKNFSVSLEFQGVLVT